MPRTGRPREFDKTQAVRQAMRLFWARGYEATSLSELKAAMGGLSTASFYAAFGSKDALFKTVVAHYRETHGRVTAPLRDPDLTPRAAIERALRQSARMQTDPDHPQGCFIVLGAATSAAENEPIRALLAAERAETRAGFESCARRAIAAGELPPDADPADLATLFSTFLFGISTQARDGVPIETLEAAIGRLMGIWDALARTEPASP
ncbi:TetR family transcriptional regulator [Aliidongia dinghuensis]|uniref:TetR family transcriptional regulator n=1 Tax=Aliidongia dinghuensis TaxID=1867774 RepID=A0A8J2YPC8_9PROT|nr:TetR/AcrR family transcriptional regulator [Aliidongia dinghuensis]GGF02573.1 TetR family transcriptional regulator [Aliidongia dinghuensis]